MLEPGVRTRTVIGNVDAYAWQDEGPLLAATLKTSWGETTGVVLSDPEAATLRTLSSGDGEYVGLTWREESDQLAVLRSVESEERREASPDLLVWDDAHTSSVRRILEWFGHYLKDEPAPAWITDGETWVERERRMSR